MKPILKLLFAVLALLQICHAEEAEEGDPVVGRWRWNGKQLVDCRPDGTFTAAPSNRKGTWEYVKDTTVERKYVFRWDGDLYTDIVTMARSGELLKGKNEDNAKVSAVKIAAAAMEKDPILGRWRWIENQIVECHSDGTFTVSPNGRKGIWEYLEGGGSKRKYAFRWDGGRFVDTLEMAKDQDSLKGKNQENKAVSAKRINGH